MKECRNLFHFRIKFLIIWLSRRQSERGEAILRALRVSAL